MGHPVYTIRVFDLTTPTRTVVADLQCSPRRSKVSCHRLADDVRAALRHSRWKSTLDDMRRHRESFASRWCAIRASSIPRQNRFVVSWTRPFWFFILLAFSSSEYNDTVSALSLMKYYAKDVPRTLNLCILVLENVLCLKK